MTVDRVAALEETEDDALAARAAAAPAAHALWSEEDLVGFEHTRRVAIDVRTRRRSGGTDAERGC